MSPSGIYKRSEEAKRKISESLKGRKLSEETKRKMSESKKGSKHSKEAKRKISEYRKGSKHTEKTKKKMSEAHKGSKHHNWKGGRHVAQRGYIYIHKPQHPYPNNKSYVLEHRLVMENHLCRYLTKEEIVHHINGIKSDNRLENLQLFKSSGEHLAFELTIKINKRELHHLYYSVGLSGREIGGFYGCSDTTIKRFMSKNNMKIRTLKEAQMLWRKRQHLTE